MNRAVKTSILVAAIIGAIILLPRSGNTTKTQAEIKQVNIRQSVLVDEVKSMPSGSPEVQVQELDTTGAAIIQLNTEVTEQTVNETIDQIKDALAKKKQAIYLLLDSPGGSVYDGARLITAMDNSEIPVYTVCTDLCASMAAQILEHGMKRYMVDRTTVMFHSATTSVDQDGEIDKIYSRLGRSKRFIDKLDYYVAARSGMTYEQFKFKAMQEYWDDAEDALRDHLIDGIVTIDFVKQVIPTPLTANKIKQQLKDLRLE